VRTILGDVAPDDLGVVDYHDHLFQTTPLLPGDDLDDEEKSCEETSDLVAAGVNTLVEATPIGMGRMPSGVARISRITGLHVVHTTGVHREAHYASQPDLISMTAEQLSDTFRAELLEGLPDDSQTFSHRPQRYGRAGLIKIGIGYWAITDFERRSLEAAGAVSAELGAPVMVHLEYGSAAHEVLTMLGEAGCPDDRVALAHIDRNPDPGLHLELAARGAYLGYDGCARHKSWPDSVLIDCLEEVVAGGGANRTLLGGDVARSSRYRAYGGMPGLSYTYLRFLPRVRSAIGRTGVEQLTTANPAEWLTWSNVT